MDISCGWFRTDARPTLLILHVKGRDKKVGVDADFWLAVWRSNNTTHQPESERGIFSKNLLMSPFTVKLVKSEQRGCWEAV